jgi:hypothetical protein
MPSARLPAPSRCSTTSAATSHQVAISNNRLISLQDGCVRFRYRDYADGNRRKTMSLDAQGVDPPFPAAHSAQKLYAHPPLRTQR